MDTGKIYLQGFDDYLQGRSSTENPYEYDSDEYCAWDHGWNSAYDEEEEYGVYDEPVQYGLYDGF